MLLFGKVLQTKSWKLNGYTPDTTTTTTSFSSSSPSFLPSLPLNPLVQAGLNLTPKPHDFHVAKRNDLTSNNATQPILAIGPPKQIWQPCPPSRTPAPTCRARMYM